MVAGAPSRTLHAAVAGKEVTAVAEGEAVRLVLAQELVGGHARDGLRGHRAARVVAVEDALHPAEVRDSGAVGPWDDGPLLAVGLREPLHLAVADEGVPREEHFRLRLSCKMGQSS